VGGDTEKHVERDTTMHSCPDLMYRPPTLMGWGEPAPSWCGQKSLVASAWVAGCNKYTAAMMLLSDQGRSTQANQYLVQM
jgi:hypothetical protein